MGKIYHAIVFLLGSFSFLHLILWKKLFSFYLGNELGSTTLVVTFFLTIFALLFFASITLLKKLSTVAASINIWKCFGYAQLLLAVSATLSPLFFDLLETLPFYLSLLLLFTMMTLPLSLIAASTSLLALHTNLTTRLSALLAGSALATLLLHTLYLEINFPAPLLLTVSGVLHACLAAFLIFSKKTNKAPYQEVLPAATLTSPLPLKLLYAVAAINGGVLITLLYSWNRLVILSLGDTLWTSSMVTILFLLGIFLGVLFKANSNAPTYLFQQILLATIFISLSFLSVSYLPLLTNNIRVVLISHPVTFYLYYVLITLLFALILLPFSFFQGRIFKLTFQLKQQEALAFHTLGAGCLLFIFCYLALYFIGLDLLFKFAITAIFLLQSYFAWWLYHHHWQLQLPTTCVVATPLILTIVVFSQWNRTHHAQAIFFNQQLRPEIHLQS
ncbi:MAG: hypothetical protein HQK50_16065, partial [Oligoflexia bacterium]|nr:hypothetical protein [Oligoflexia bacterium]